MSVQVKGSGTIGGLDEGLVVSGIVTSSTQINVGSNIKLGSAGIVTATSFVGSGANLTSLPSQVTIANNADNRVITGGSGTNLNGESTLTYNPSILTITNASGASEITLVTPSANDSGVYFNDGSNSGALSYNHSDNSMRFRVNATEKVRITSDGYVHIGNTAHGTNKVGGQAITGQDYDPVVKVYSSGSNNWLAQLRSDHTSGNGIFLRAGNSSSTYTLYATGYDENNAHFLVRGDGVCSIGAKYTQGGANPQLSMYGSSGRQFKIMNSGANTTGMQLQNSTTGYGEDAGVQFACLGGGHTYLVNQYNGADFLWYSRTGGSSKHIFTIYDDGKIANQTNTDNLMLSNSQDGSGSNYFLRGSKNSTTPGGGNDCVWIYEDGDIRNNNNSYGQQSDIKLKENIVDAGTQWDDIKNLKVRKFNFKASTGFDTHTQIGLIAQEAELVSPGLVKEVKDRVKTEQISEVDGSTSYKESLSETEKTKHVMYSVLYMKSVKALQEAQARIETLEAKVAALEGS